jgi:hypothetical protein
MGMPDALLVVGCLDLPEHFARAGIERDEEGVGCSKVDLVLKDGNTAMAQVGLGCANILGITPRVDPLDLP